MTYLSWPFYKSPKYSETSELQAKHTNSGVMNKQTPSMETVQRRTAKVIAFPGENCSVNSNNKLSTWALQSFIE